MECYKKKFTILLSQKMSQQPGTEETRHNAPSAEAYSLVPTVRDGQHPLFVDEHPPTEVVTVVERGHEWTRVRLALLAADDSPVSTGNRRWDTHLG